jgi:DNA-binding HxlR family transcriptional regulator
VQCLRRLQEHGLVQRQVFTEGPLAVEYAVTLLGRTLEAPVQAMLEWSARNAAEVEAARQAFRKGRG